MRRDQFGGGDVSHQHTYLFRLLRLWKVSGAIGADFSHHLRSGFLLHRDIDMNHCASGSEDAAFAPSGQRRRCNRFDVVRYRDTHGRRVVARAAGLRRTELYAGRAQPDVETVLRRLVKAYSIAFAGQD